MTLSGEQVRSALQDMFNVFCELPLEAQELFIQKTYDVMEQTNNTSFRSFSVFKRFYKMALDYGVQVDHGSVLEIGSGKPWGMGLFWNLVGAAKYTSIDKFLPVHLDPLWLSRFNWFLNMNLKTPAHFKTDDFIWKDETGYHLNRERIDLIQDSFETYPFPPDSFDYIYSVAVLEHVTAIETLLKKMHDVLKKSGTMIHVIDLREHHTHLRKVPDKKTSLDFLQYSQAEWEKLYPPGSEYYINRLRASDFEGSFRAAGFEIADCEVTQRMALSEDSLAKIHSEFQKYSRDDLEIAGIRVVLRKN